jgi:hypothetical protein
MTNTLKPSPLGISIKKWTPVYLKRIDKEGGVFSFIRTLVIDVFP